MLLRLIQVPLMSAWHDTPCVAELLHVVCCLLYAVWSAYKLLSAPVNKLLVSCCTDADLGVQSVMHGHTVGTHIIPDIEKVPQIWNVFQVCSKLA